jgi:hypothetical protein
VDEELAAQAAEPPQSPVFAALPQKCAQLMVNPIGG